MTGELYVIATPIGNLGDMVPRAVEVLQAADLIAVEDTRHSGRLLDHFGIDKPMMAYHDHGDGRQTTRILAALEAGQTVALISDAGTPLISDPGYKLVREVRQQGFGVIPIPGACAAIAALSAAGLPSDRFTFEGFPPHKSGPRLKKLQGLTKECRTIIYYEAPHRVLATLEDMQVAFGEDREVVIARELTKNYETFLTGTLEEVCARVAADSNQQRGEIVIIVRGAEESGLSESSVEQDRVLNVLLAELPLKQASALAAKITGGQKNALYQRALELKAMGLII